MLVYLGHSPCRRRYFGQGASTCGFCSNVPIASQWAASPPLQKMNKQTIVKKKEKKELLGVRVNQIQRHLNSHLEK